MLTLKVTKLREPQTDFKDLSDTLAAGDDTLFLFGGTHFNRTTDGKKMAHAALDLAIRGVLAKGDEVWVCGTGLSRSNDGGQTFKSIALPAAAGKLMKGFAGGLHAVGADGDGAIWTGGADGLLLAGDGAKFAIVKGLAAKEQVTCIVAGGDGGTAIIATNRGGVYLGKRRKVAKAKLATKGPIYGASATPRGTVVVVGDGIPLGPGRKTAVGVAFRSEDGGKTFSAARVPKAPPLRSIASLPDGRLVVGGEEDALLVSDDDGKSFTAIAHTVKHERHFASAVAFRDAVYVTGPGHALARIA
jgi:hypothetical protein